MSTETLPYFRQFSQSRAVGQDANRLNREIENSNRIFIGHSVQSELLYKKQLKDRFLDLKSKWKSDTIFSSNSDEIVNNPNYIKIIDLGEDVIPFILEDLQVTNNHWFVALKNLTNVDPTEPNHRGDIIALKNDWLTWANNENIL